MNPKRARNPILAVFAFLVFGQLSSANPSEPEPESHPGHHPLVQSLIQGEHAVNPDLFKIDGSGNPISSIDLFVRTVNELSSHPEGEAFLPMVIRAFELPLAKSIPQSPATAYLGPILNTGVDVRARKLLLNLAVRSIGKLRVEEHEALFAGLSELLGSPYTTTELKIEALRGMGGYKGSRGLSELLGHTRNADTAIRKAAFEGLRSVATDYNRTGDTTSQGILMDSL